MDQTRTGDSLYPAPISVLVVDDHPVVRDGYRRLLESTGEITVAAEADSGESAYETYKRQPTDVVIMELILPGAGGLDAIRRIVRRDADARVLAFSMYENPLFIRKSREAGAIGYVSKRGSPESLVEAVRNAAAGKSYFVFGDSVTVEAKTADNDIIERLTLREFEVFQLLALGHSVAEVAKLLNISHNTAGVHQTRIMSKLGLHNAAQLARLAIRNGIINA